MKKIFKNRNFKLLFYGNFVSSIGNTLFNFALSWYILEITNSPLQAGIFMSVGALIQIVLTPFTGVVADHFPKNKVVYITDFIRGITVIVSGIIIFFNSSILITLITLYATTIILATNAALFSPAVGGLQAEVVPKEDYQSANAAMSMINSLQGIIGIVIGGTLYALLGVFWIFIIDGVSFIVSGISEMFIIVKEKEVGQLSWKSGLIDLKEGIEYLISQGGLMYLMFGALFLNFAFTPVFANGLPYLFNQVLRTDPTQYAIVSISFSLGALLSAIVIGNIKKQLDLRRSMFIGLAGMIILFIIFTFETKLILDGSITLFIFILATFITLFLFGVVNMYLNTPLNTAFMKSIDEEYRGRAFGVIGTLSQGLVPLALLYGGIMLESFGILTLSVVSCGILVVVTLFIFSSRKINGYLDDISSL